MGYENLFSPVKIGSMTVKNRIGMMAMGVISPRLTNLKDGSYTKDGADYYIARAKGGTGLIVTGVMPIVGHYMNPSNSPETYTENQKYLADGVHKYGGKVVVQLTALTGRSGIGGDEPAPSEEPNVWDPTRKNPMMTKEEIHQYVKNFATASYAAKQAGIDGVEIHAVHEGYLLDQFTISSMNHRTDEYGGSLENRLRFPCEIVQAIKEKCGKDFPVLVRYSVKSYIKGFNRGALPGEEFEEFGRDYEESAQVAKLLEKAGYDALDCDNGCYDAWYWPHPPVYMPKACNLKDVTYIKQQVSIPVICAGKFDDPDLADREIKAGHIDMVGLGRPMLADPDIANKYESGDLDDIRPCVGCHQGCLGRIMYGLDISCALNPQTGREDNYPIGTADEKKHIVIIGGGLGGMETARISALRGHEVDLYEKSNELGGVYIASSQPDFKSDDRRLLNWYRKQLKDLHVNVHLNTEVKKDMLKPGSYDELVIASGASEKHLDIPGLDPNHRTYAIDALLNHREFEGNNLIIVGGGLTGCEMAVEYAKQGKKVTIVEASPTIMNTPGLCAANYNMLMEMMDYYKVTVLKNTVVGKVIDGKASLIHTIYNEPNIANRAKLMAAVGPEGIKQTIEIPCDFVIISIGYTANQDLYNEIKGEHVHLVGDASKPANVLEAIWAANDLARTF